MNRRSLRELLSSTEGAVAPTIALSLFGLIVVGGVAVDYSRMASLDTELQNAADQAALAAASQLDGSSGACTRAALAARNMVANAARMANDGSGWGVVVATETGCDAAGNVRFYQDADKATAATSDANARFVEVEVNPKQAYYALTPLAKLFASGNMTGIALAGLGQAICKTPPVMICNPQETSGNTAFDAAALIGKGLRLVTVGGGNGSWAPGNFGYLDTSAGSNGAPGLREALGWETAPGDCLPATGVNTKPGATVSVTDALNTRFDIYDSNVSCPTGGNCGASINSVKDVARNANANGGNACRLHNAGWNEGATSTAYGWGTLPSSATTALADTVTPSVMGHPPDMCHAVPSSAAGACTGPIGNGNWDRNAYFRTNYGWSATQWPGFVATGLKPITTSTPTRYQVYQWEIANRNGPPIGGKTILGSRIVSGSGASAFTSYGTPQCSPTEGYGSGVVPDEDTPDRRKISVAVVNCIQQNVKGSETGLTVKEWLDVFLVQPALDRGSGGSQVSSTGDIYVEVIGTTQAASDTSIQVVKKAVPYLIQ